jgi:diadenosine tetraphosphate (Ap4A) HIT family hydrolase
MLRGDITPPGGILYQNAGWALFLRSRPPLAAGQGFIVLKRHCERVADLTAVEQATLGPMMAAAAWAMDAVLKPEKIHFGLYGEGVKHIHLHVTPRLATLPAGNIPLVWLGTWYDLLERLRLRRPISDASVSAVAAQLRTAFENIADGQTK